ncbi:MAG: tripartite tricarboxylate transporter permease [Gemmatimonadota bacterium]|jgi:TctA family transporter
MHTIGAAIDGIALVFSWPNILIPVLGTLAAMAFAVLPGISGITLMALAVPLTFQWEPVSIVLLFGALTGGATFMGSVTAILLNIPGSAPNAATLIDGFPLARKGEARTALAASATASALGSTFGIIVLLTLIPAVSLVIPRIGPPEYLMLAIWGLATIGTVVRGSVVKGLAMAGLGLLASFIGLDPRTAAPRYTFGSLYLQDGLGLVPVFLGLFAVAEVIGLMTSGRATISGHDRPERLTGSSRTGIHAVLREPGLLLRSSLIGTMIGMIPGLGGTVAAFVAYGDAARRTRKGRFGHGDIRGVIAPEAANDAKDGGALLPTLALGIPASAGTAMLLGVLTLHGIRPGAELMDSRLPLVFTLIGSLFLSNWITSVLGLALVRPLARLTVVRTTRLVPAILGLVVLGSFAWRGRTSDVGVALGFGLLGWLMKKHGWPRVAFVIAFVLGALFEQNLRLTLSLQQLGRIQFWTRPSVLAIALLIVVTVLLPRTRRTGA